MIVGTPNVGKSVLFNRLTGRYVVVSNYPGTTVEISRGKTWIGGSLFEVIDTPGMYSLRAHSDEERVARNLLMREPAEIVLHVVDAEEPGADAGLHDGADRGRPACRAGDQHDGRGRADRPADQYGAAEQPALHSGLGDRRPHGPRHTRAKKDAG